MVVKREYIAPKIVFHKFYEESLIYTSGFNEDLNNGFFDDVEVNPDLVD